MKGKLLEPSRVKYTVDREGFWARSAVTLMLLSAVFRLIGTWGLWDDLFFAVTQIALPLACCLLFILCLLLLGKRFFAATSLPVLLGVVFFIIKAIGFESWVHMVLCILLYLLVAVLYTATAFGYVHTKWLLVPLFGLPFLYHVFVEDLAALTDVENPLSFSAGMQEMSVLCVMLALLCTALAMKKTRAGEPETKPEKKAKKEPKKEAEKAPEKVPEKTPEKVPEKTPEKVPERTPEKATETTPEAARKRDRFAPPWKKAASPETAVPGGAPEPPSGEPSVSPVQPEPSAQAVPPVQPEPLVQTEPPAQAEPPAEEPGEGGA